MLHSRGEKKITVDEIIDRWSKKKPVGIYFQKCIYEIKNCL